MAKTSKRVKDARRREVVARHAERRKELTAVLKSATATPAQREAARAELSRQPRDASATRLRNRDSIDGRPRGYLRVAGVSRIRFRELAHAGELPGIRKSSW